MMEWPVAELDESEVWRTFEALGLATQEQRDSVLFKALVKPTDEPSEPHYETRLSNASESERLSGG